MKHSSNIFNIIAVLPARLASSRFPNKPLAKILGMPMIGHCYLRTKMCKLLKDVYVATCDVEIADYIASIGGKAVMTANTHERASDRTAEAVQKVEAATGTKADIVVMVQGDEPMVMPEMIDKAVRPMLTEPDVLVTNLMADLPSREGQDDPSEVKVVVDLKGNALYFSREPIPSRKKAGREVPVLKQVCVIPFRRDFLFQYLKMAPTPLEIIESIDMNRILEHGYRVRMVKIEQDTYAVDTPADLTLVEEMMQKDPLIACYKNQLLG